MKRTIHLWSIFLCAILWIGLILLLISWIKTHDVITNKTNAASYLLLGIIGYPLVAVGVTGTLLCGLAYIAYRDAAPGYYQTINIVNGVLYILGGFILASPIISIWLWANE